MVPETTEAEGAAAPTPASALTESAKPASSMISLEGFQPAGRGAMPGGSSASSRVPRKRWAAPWMQPSVPAGTWVQEAEPAWGSRSAAATEAEGGGASEARVAEPTPEGPVAPQPSTRVAGWAPAWSAELNEQAWPEGSSWPEKLVQ